ncbi:alpha/beta hydrolase [Ferruginibacter sp.]
MIKNILSFFFLVFWAAITNAQTNTYHTKQNTPPVIAGVADSLHSDILGENRRLAIYLPPGYSPDSAYTYPVIYLLDGGAEEDFLHVAGLVQYFTTPWVKQFPPSIIVGIENVNRQRDFTYATDNLDFVTKMGLNKKNFGATGGSAKFINFIEKELQPFIKTHYKTNGTNSIIGESLGGLLATEILFKAPSLFSTYVIISPSLWWGNESLLKTTPAIANNNFTDKVKIYVGAADKKENDVMYTDATTLALQLRNIHRPNISVHFDYLAGEKHATIIHQAVYNAFKILYAK